MFKSHGDDSFYMLIGKRIINDFSCSPGFDQSGLFQNPELMKIYNSKKGTGGAKSSFGDVQYLNEIIRSSTFDRMKAYGVSGVRIQSFSDYVPRMVFDYVQVVADLAAKKLPAHAYTKEKLFVYQFGLTGVKINLSLVPDVVADPVQGREADKRSSEEPSPLFSKTSSPLSFLTHHW